MIIFPAVDIQNKKAVRLKQGRPDESTVFSNDPVDTALLWQKRGAKWLHIVDLDGAFNGSMVNYDIVKEICSQLNIPVQLGGGIRDFESARSYFDIGVTRLIIGTMALEQPETFKKICRSFPGKVGVSLDADNGRLKTRGWIEDTGLSVDAVLHSLEEAGTAFIVYTDIMRDGMQSGINLSALEWLSRESSVPVLAAGGVATIDDVKALLPLSKRSRLEGVISGRALYEGTLSLEDANAWLASQD